MSRPLDVKPAEAVAFVAFILGWNARELPVYVDGKERFTVDKGTELARRAARLDEKDREVSVGLPVGESPILWCWVQGSQQVWRAARFRPVPSLVLRMGFSSRRLLIWHLRETVPNVLLEHSNEKIAYACHAPRTSCAAADLRVPLPGTFLRIGRKHPVPVLVTKMDLVEYTREEVVGTLKQPPAPFMQRVREGRASLR